MRAFVLSRSRVDQAIEALPFLIIIVATTILTFWSLFGATYTELIPAFSDDAFYYFQVAHKISQGQGSTFDGIHATNGYHPLWMSVSIGVFSVARTKLEALVIIRVVALLSWIASVVIVYKTSRILKSSTLFFLSLPMLFGIHGLWLNGLETCLALLVFFWLAYIIVKHEREPREGAGPYILLGVTLSLLLLSRLDTVFFIFVFGGATVLLGLGREKFTRLVLVPGLPLASLILYVCFNWVFFDTATPISGQAKAIGGGGPNWSVFSAFLGRHPVHVLSLKTIEIGTWILVLLLPTALLCLRNEWKRFRAPGAGDGFRDFERLFLFLIAANGLQLCYFAITSSWQLWSHYHYYIPILLIFAPPILVNALAGQGWQKLKLPIQLVLVLVLVYLCGTTIRHRRWRGPAPAFQEFNDASVEVAKFLNANTEPDAVFTMGDRAGSLGFQLDRSLVHTEGLVNSKQYLDALKAGSVHAFLRASGVDYVVYSGGPKSGGFPVPTNAVAGEECATFREPKFGNGPKVEFVVCEEDLIFSSMLRSSGAGGGLYNVWRYRPSINLDHPPLGH